MKNWYNLALFTLFAFSIMGALFLWHLSLVDKRTEIVFLNVGQGDAILISQGSSQILIDGGRTGRELLARLGRHVPFWDRTIEFVIATHPDADHIGGLPAVLRAYTVNQILTTGAESATETSRLFQEVTTQEIGSAPTKIFQGTEIVFPSGGKLSVEYPVAPLSGVSTADTNQGSVVARFVYGETSFLLTGDLAREETALPEVGQVNILKVAHHGSKHSTSEAFLRLVKPQEAIISVGENWYGHPDQSVLKRLEDAGVRIYRTDEEGDIRYRCFDRRCTYAP